MKFFFIFIFGFSMIATWLLPSAQADTRVFDQQMQSILIEYLKIQKALAQDTTNGVNQAALNLAQKAITLNPKNVKGLHAKHYQDLPQKIIKAAKQLSQAKTLGSVREVFKVLSKPFAMWSTMSKPKGINVVYCSMAKGSWLQAKGEIRNPYHGASMLTCGEVVSGE